MHGRFRGGSELRLFFPASELAPILFDDDYEYGIDEQVYIVSSRLSYTRSEILALTRPERIALFERIVKDIENEADYKRAVYQALSRAVI